MGQYNKIIFKRKIKQSGADCFEKTLKQKDSENMVGLFCILQVYIMMYLSDFYLRDLLMT